MTDDDDPRAAPPQARNPAHGQARNRGERHAAGASLPSLFGRFTGILSNRQPLGVILERLDGMRALLEAGSGAPREGLPVRKLSADLRRELSALFAAEEAEGYYGVIVAERPALQPRVSDLTREHAAMLEVIEAFDGVSSDPAQGRELSARTKQLLEMLEAHECREQMLLQACFLDNEAQGPSCSGAGVRDGEGEFPFVVIVVDDEPAVRLAVRRMLERVGCGVEEAADAMSALLLLGDRRKVIDAVVSDVGLPGILGSELVLAARVIRPKVATLLMSGDRRDYLVATGRIPPDAELLEKPFRADQLMARLAAILEWRG